MNSANEHDPQGNSDTDPEQLPVNRRGAGESEDPALLRERLARAAADVQALQGMLRTREAELERMQLGLSAALNTLREQLERVERSAAWRYGHWVARVARRARFRRPITEGGVAAALGQVERIFDLLGRPRSWPPAVDAPSENTGALATREQQLQLGQRVRDALGPPASSPARGLPQVTAVLISRSPARVERTLERLSECDYPPLDVVVVDNGSPQGAVSRSAALDRGRSVEVEQLAQPLGFAQACNRGAERAASELLLFINDDLDPIEPGWLRELVAPIRDGESHVVGATLVSGRVGAGVVLSGRQVGREASEAAGPNLSLEQRGITIGMAGGAPFPAGRETGGDVFGPGFGLIVPAVAVSGACMLIGRQTFERLGGFDSGYQYGLEDVDLCLRARARGYTVACAGRAVVVHAGSATQMEAGREFRRINRELNRRRFRSLWAPALRRERLAGLLAGDPIWGERPHAAIVRTSNDPAEAWGDHHTAAELGEALASEGWRITFIAQRDSAADIPDDLDLAVVLLDRWDATALPDSTLAFAWVRNWTERWLERAWLDRYDALLASSTRSARLLRDATGRPVEDFPLATNPRRFHPPPAGTVRTLDWVLTANHWGVPRAVEAGMRNERGMRGAIYGRGWKKSGELRRLIHDPVAYDELGAVYQQAHVVLDDAAEPTLAYDAVNARVFDALASGALVLTNCRQGVRELFDADFPTWSSGEELRAQLNQLMAAPDRRAELTARYRQRVLECHTYAHRARRLRELVQDHNERLSFCLKIGAPDRQQAERWGDLHVANGLGRALRRLGHRWRVDVRSEWDDPGSSSFDVAVALHGRLDHVPARGQLNVLWLISHPESFDPATVVGYDLVCVASEPFAAQLREQVETPVQVLEQATDPRVFFPEASPELSHDLAFVGNSRGVRRKILDDLLPTSHDLAVWGTGWKGTPVQRHLVADHVPNQELRKVYSSAAIVLCDHWPDMRRAGFRSNRLFDALACGAVVVSDRVAGLEGSLGEAVLTYEDRDELEALIERLLSAPEERVQRSRNARARILAGETFDDRARALVRWVEEAASRRRR